MDDMIKEVYFALENRQYDLNSETATQNQISQYLEKYQDIHQLSPLLKGWFVKKEYNLSKKDRVDFFIKGPGIAIEVKIQGSPVEILRQCERYCRHSSVKAIILASAKFMGLPETIKGKPAYFIHLSRGLL